MLIARIGTAAVFLLALCGCAKPLPPEPTYHQCDSTLAGQNGFCIAYEKIDGSTMLVEWAGDPFSCTWTTSSDRRHHVHCSRMSPPGFTQGFYMTFYSDPNTLRGTWNADADISSTTGEVADSVGGSYSFGFVNDDTPHRVTAESSDGIHLTINGGGTFPSPSGGANQELRLTDVQVTLP